jgi:hypothetical protein
MFASPWFVFFRALITVVLFWSFGFKCFRLLREEWKRPGITYAFVHALVERLIKSLTFRD